MARQQRNSRGDSRREADRKPPDFRVYAVIDKAGKDEQPDWVYLGGAWIGNKESISFSLLSEPLAWRNPAVPRRVTLIPTDE